MRAIWDFKWRLGPVWPSHCPGNTQTRRAKTLRPSIRSAQQTPRTAAPLARPFTPPHLDGGVDVHGLRGGGDGGLLIGLGRLGLLDDLHRLLLSVRHGGGVLSRWSSTARSCLPGDALKACVVCGRKGSGAAATAVSWVPERGSRAQERHMKGLAIGALSTAGCYYSKGCCVW